MKKIRMTIAAIAALAVGYGAYASATNVQEGPVYHKNGPDNDDFIEIQIEEKDQSGGLDVRIA